MKAKLFSPLIKGVLPNIHGQKSNYKIMVSALFLIQSRLSTSTIQKSGRSIMFTFFVWKSFHKTSILISFCDKSYNIWIMCQKCSDSYRDSAFQQNQLLQNIHRSLPADPCVYLGFNIYCSLII